MLLALLPRQRAATPGWQRHKKSSVIENAIQKINVSMPKCRIIPNWVGLIHLWLNSGGAEHGQYEWFLFGARFKAEEWHHR